MITTRNYEAENRERTRATAEEALRIADGICKGNRFLIQKFIDRVRVLGLAGLTGDELKARLEALSK